MDTEPALTLEAALPPDLAPRLARHPVFAALRTGRSRGAAEERIWHDTADGALAAAGLMVETRRGARALLRILPAPGEAWSPARPPPVVRDLARNAVPEEAEGAALLPVAAFSGRRQAVPLGPVQATLLVGQLRTVAAARGVARLILTGPAAETCRVMRALAETLPLLPPSAALAEEGRALARGEEPRSRCRGAPGLAAASSVDDALARAMGHLLEVALVQRPVAAAGARPEGVHQLRVALRRLRSALRVFRRAVDAEALRSHDATLRGVLNALGPARDWDVWLSGTGAALAEAMPDEARIDRLRAAARGERAEAYAQLRDLLEGPAFRTMAWDGVTLLAGRAWRDGASEETLAALAAPLDAFAAPLLGKRWKRLRRDARGIAELDAHGLHELRLDAKRLRYAAEMFAPLWPGKGTRRFLHRLAALQEVLGLANDAAVARALVAHLGTPPAMRWAVGAAEGWAAARVSGIRENVARSWERLSDTDPFWPEA